MAKKNSRILPADELSRFCTEMGMLMRSGMSIHDGLAAHIRVRSGGLSADAADDKDIFTRLYIGVRDGHTLSETMEKTGVFPADFIGMVMIGEESGSLDAVFENLAAHYQRSSEVGHEIRSALTWPLLTLCMMAVILQVLTRRVFPVFTSIYESLGGGLSDSAAASIAVGSAFAKVLTVLAVLLILIAAVIWFLRRTRRRALLTALQNRLPFISGISVQLTAARFADSLAMMLDAGFDTEESLLKIGEAFGDHDLQKKIDTACRMLAGENGPPAPLSEALCSLGLWNETECQMIRSSTRFGDLDRMLRYLAVTGMDKAEVDIAKAVSLVEPVMIALMAILIGSILLSVMLPLSGIMAAIG